MQSCHNCRVSKTLIKYRECDIVYRRCDPTTKMVCVPKIRTGTIPYTTEYMGTEWIVSVSMQIVIVFQIIIFNVRTQW